MSSATVQATARRRRLPLTSPSAAGWAALIVALAIAPLFLDRFSVLQLTLILVYAVAILGLDVLVGHAGQVSLGQSAFFGLGAYVAAYAFNEGWGAIPALGLAVASATLVGFLAAVPAVRLRGFAFGIITLALPVVAVPLANRLVDVTGGSQGLAIVALLGEGTGLAEDQYRFYIVAIVSAVMFALVGSLLRGRIGRALSAIRLNEALAASMGVPVQRYKIVAFTVAAACAGVAGWMYLITVQFISPDTLLLTLSVALLVGLVVGGVRSPLGYLLGAAFLVLVPNITDKISPGRSFLVYGLVLTVVLFAFRAGLAGALRQGVRRVMQATSGGNQS